MAEISQKGTHYEHLHQNHEEIKAIGEGENSENRCVMVGVALDMFENIHGLKHDAYARAEYVEKYAPASLSFDQKKLLYPEQYED